MKTLTKKWVKEWIKVCNSPEGQLFAAGMDVIKKEKVEASQKTSKWKGDVCEKCGCKDFDRFYSGGYNFMTCKKCGAEYLDD